MEHQKYKYPKDATGKFKKGTWLPKVKKTKNTCIVCSNAYYRTPSHSKAKRKVCSRFCYYESKKGEKQSHLLKRGKFKKDIAKKISVALTGKRQPWNTGKKHAQWKGINATYNTKHQWLKNNYGRATHCENPSCKYPRKNAANQILNSPKIFHWALIHGKKYDHKRENFMMLCPSCHKKYDQNIITIKK